MVQNGFRVLTFLGAALVALSSGVSAQSRVHHFDQLNRLIRVVYSDGTTVTYTYDHSGNRLTETVVAVAAPCAFVLAPPAATRSSAAGVGSVEVITAAGCSWTAVSNTDFLAVVSGAAGIGPGTVTYSIAANLGAERAGALTVAGRAFVVTQSVAPPVPPTVSTTPVTAITKNAATSGGIVVADGGAAVTARGVCWATTPIPTIAGTCVSAGSGSGAFASALAGLIPETTYHLRAFATNSAGTSYGDTVFFTTRPIAPTTITVTSFTDSIAVNGDCTLREAFQAANTDSPVDQCGAGNGADTIQLQAGTYRLAIAGKGEDANLSGDIDVVENLTVVGAGAATTIIDAAQLDRALEIVATATVKISGLTIRNGSSFPFSGGGIFARGTTTLTGVVVTANSAGGAGGGGVASEGQLTMTNSTVNANSSNIGGGLESRGALTLQDTIVRDNMAGSGGGGGVAFAGSQLSLTKSQISHNTTTGSGGGFFSSGVVTVDRSLIAGNGAAVRGGGILNFGTMTVVNSTITGNASGSGDGAGGGAIYNNATLHVESSTITANTAGVDGAGILNRNAVTMKRTIVADNSPNNCTGEVTSNGYNLVSDHSCALASTGDIANTPALIGQLANNGGDTFTHALLTGSPAINAGGSGCASTTDQRGIARPQGAACDIGAYEREFTNTPPTFTPHPPMSAIATSAYGAVVAYAPTGNDAEDGVIPAVCSPPSGSLWALGTRTAYCTVTDSAGATATGSFTVSVIAVAAAITSPTPATQLIASTVLFHWTPGSGVSEYRLQIGSAPGLSDIYSQELGTSLSAAVAGLPHNGAPLFVRLGSKVAGWFVDVSYEYTASNSFVPWLGFGSAEPVRVDPALEGARPPSPIAAELISPIPISVLTTSSVVLEWSAGRGVSEYGISVGTTPGGSDLFHGELGTELSVTISDIPLNGRPVYVRVWSEMNGEWRFTDYLFFTAGP